MCADYYVAHTGVSFTAGAPRSVTHCPYENVNKRRLGVTHDDVKEKPDK